MIRKINYCPACGISKASEVVILNSNKKEDYFKYSQVKYNHFLDGWLEQLDVAIDACVACGHHRYREQPSEEMLFDMYEKGKPLLPQNNANNKEPTLKMIREMERLKKVLNLTTPKLLDYGSGFGRWARAAKNTGFKVIAYEPSKERGVENNKIDFTLVHNVSDLENQLFDAINLEQVLEHVPDPVELLKELHGYCTPNTLVRITVPNILRCPEGGNIWNEWPYNGQRAHTMAPFEHLHGFTPNSLKTVAIRAGFKSVNNLYVWVQYPKEMLRSYIGKLFPKFGQTFLLIKIDE